jgi:hypothetical protein
VNERVAAELALLRSAYPEAELHGEGPWARIPAYPIDESIWGRATVEAAFQFVLPGQPPYGFWVRPGLTLATGAAIQNYSYPVETSFGPDWGQFSWSPEDWSAQEDPRPAGNMLRWARSFAQRLAEGA